jgi:cytochrome c peroxidase
MNKTWVMLAGMLLILAACGGPASEAPDAPDSDSSAALGAQLFAESTLGGQAGCATCHSLSPETVIVGPTMAQIGQAAAQRVPGMTAEEYLRQSIIDPNAYVVDGFTPNIMPRQYGEKLTTEEIDNLVDYMLSLQ